MGEPVVVAPGAGEVVGDAPDRRVEILCDDDALHATWSRFGPRRDGADLHVHRRHSDLFYVLEGELTVRLGLEDRAVPVPAGTLARVPPLVVHGFRNAADAPVRYLNLHAPGRGFADFMRALRDGRTLAYDQEPPPGSGTRPPSDAVVGGAEPLGGGVTLLADTGDVAIAERADGWPGEAAHRHGHLEALYVLEGELELTLAGRPERAPAGSWVRIPAGTVHAISPGGARFLELHAPGRGRSGQPRAPGLDGPAP
jgi:quercetin dioxygenase-like cupin family protein